MSATTIQWTDETWNPTTGCTKVSEGCRYCYAERVFPRTAAGQTVADHGLFRKRKFTDIRTHSDRLEQPLHWKKPRRVFVNSMSDLFHEAVPFGFIDRVFAIMAADTGHTFQVLTKRADRMLEYMQRYRGSDYIGIPTELVGIAQHMNQAGLWPDKIKIQIKWPLPNVHLGVSVEDPKTAAERIPKLRQTAAAVRFVSYEPALAGVDFTVALKVEPKLDWIIVGGESGSRARPFNIFWARDVIGQCKRAGVPVFVKQLGFRPYKTDLGFEEYLFLNSKKGGDPSEWPEDLRVREYPNEKNRLEGIQL